MQLGTALYLVSVLVISSVSATPNIDWKSISPAARAELASAVIVDDISFENTPLLQCLKELSQAAKDSLGRGFSITIQGKPSPESEAITMRLKCMTLREVFSLLGNITGSKIEMTEGGCLVTFDSQ